MTNREVVIDFIVYLIRAGVIAFALSLTQNTSGLIAAGLLLALVTPAHPKRKHL